MELSKTKTLITHARSETARFLGYNITVLQSDEKQTQTSGEQRHTAHRRCINARIGLEVPKEVIKEKRQRYRQANTVIHRAELLSESDFSIISRYQLEYQGLVNYYRLAYNLRTLNELRYDMEISLVKTLAHKHKRSVKKTYEKYRATKDVEGKQKPVLQATVPRKDKEPLVATWGGISLAWDIKANLEEQPSTHWRGGSTELEKRLLAGYCELCGSTEDIQVHHIKAMKKVHQYPGREKPEWVKRMIALRRKTMPLCRTCHVDVHAGRPLRRQTIKLEEVKALQKAKTTILESRMR